MGLLSGLAGQSWSNQSYDRGRFVCYSASVEMEVCVECWDNFLSLQFGMFISEQTGKGSAFCFLWWNQ